LKVNRLVSPLAASGWARCGGSARGGWNLRDRERRIRRIGPQRKDFIPCRLESIYLRAHHARLGYTLETPSSLPLAHRIAAHRAACEAAIANVG
jgi:hypothetical protein